MNWVKNEIAIVKLMIMKSIKEEKGKGMTDGYRRVVLGMKRVTNKLI